MFETVLSETVFGPFPIQDLAGKFQSWPSGVPTKRRPCWVTRLISSFLQTLALGYRWPSTGVKTPLTGKLRRKSEKGFPRPLGPGVKKGSKKSRKWLFFKLFWGFWLVFDFCSGMLTPGPRGPGNPFSDFFWSFPGRGLFDSCRWPTISQISLENCNLGGRSWKFQALGP